MIYESAHGGKPDRHDPRDHAYEPTGRKGLPARIDLRPRKRLPAHFGIESPPGHFQVYDQFGLNSCTANAIAGALQFDMIRQKLRRIFVPSRMFIYYNTRAIERTERENATTSFRDGFKAVVRKGFCTEKAWPYDAAKLTKRPPRSVYDKAFRHKLLSYRRVRRDLDHLRHCLVDGWPFTLGMKTFVSFLDKPALNTGRIRMPRKNERELGYHSILVVGYDNRKRAFLVRNSFGPVWGDRGHFWLPYDFFESRKLTYDFWTLRSVS